MYSTQLLAEDALIDARIRFDFASGSGPVAVYQCEDCGQYHLTSQGPMNTRLEALLRDGKIKRQKEADHWERKFKRK